MGLRNYGLKKHPYSPMTDPGDNMRDVFWLGAIAI